MHEDYDINQISTHTPHARRDLRYALEPTIAESISTHTPHARRDRKASPKHRKHLEFQLTRLMRGVTTATVVSICGEKDFNSHASCEA